MAIKPLFSVPVQGLSGPAPGWLRLSDFGAALALANLYMLSIWDELQDPFQGYYCDFPNQTWPIFGRSVLCLLLFACFLWPLIARGPYLRNPILRKLACLFLIGTLLVGLDVIRVRFLHIYGSSITSLIGKTAFVVSIVAAAGTFLYLFLFRDRTVFRGIELLLRLLVFMVPFNLVATAWAIHTAYPIERFSRKQAPRLTSTTSRPRFIWVIFDEWDAYITFHNRPTGLLLPEIDRFRDQALHADSVLSPAFETLESLPSLTIGRVVQKSITRTPDDLLLNFADTHTAEPWSTQPNVFAGARLLGVNAAITGFYHPYPRVLGADLVESFSTARLSLGEEGDGGVQKLVFLIRYALNNVPLIGTSGILNTTRVGRIHYKVTQQRALKMVAQPDLGLVLLHYPVPHLPGIYDPPHASNRKGGPYIDNLSLADLTLKELRNAMEAAGQWDGSFVLLSSDHPLRAEGLRTLNDVKARRHPWIPFLLKMPGQAASVPYTKSFNSVLTKELILAALRGEIHTAEDAAAWLDDKLTALPPAGPKALN